MMMPKGATDYLRRAVPRLLIIILLWWILTGGDGWWLGVPMVLIATAVSLALCPSYVVSFNALAWLRFVPFFFWQSIRGGVTVARRAIDPRLPLQPGFITYPLRLPPGPARVFFANVINLLPGTLVADVCDDRLILQALDTTTAVVDETRAVEAMVGALFGVPGDRHA